MLEIQWWFAALTYGFVIMVYGGGAGYLIQSKGLLRALCWPVALGIVLAQAVERLAARQHWER